MLVSDYRERKTEPCVSADIAVGVKELCRLHQVVRMSGLESVFEETLDA